MVGIQKDCFVPTWFFKINNLKTLHLPMGHCKKRHTYVNCTPGETWCSLQLGGGIKLRGKSAYIGISIGNWPKLVVGKKNVSIFYIIKDPLWCKKSFFVNRESTLMPRKWFIIRPCSTVSIISYLFYLELHSVGQVQAAGQLLLSQIVQVKSLITWT